MLRERMWPGPGIGQKAGYSVGDLLCSLTKAMNMLYPVPCLSTDCGLFLDLVSSFSDVFLLRLDREYLD